MEPFDEVTRRELIECSNRVWNRAMAIQQKRPQQASLMRAQAEHLKQLADQLGQYDRKHLTVHVPTV